MIIWLLILLAISIWVLVLIKALKKPLGLISPTALFCFGIFIFCIIPMTYWQFRPWYYVVPSYLEGSTLVFISVILFGVPFLARYMGENRSKTFHVSKSTPWSLHHIRLKHINRLWWGVILLVFGFLWRVHLITFGYQARFERLEITVFGSEQLGRLINITGYYYPIFYFALFAFGNKILRRIGITFWILDGLLMVYTFHRYAMLLFILRSFVFLIIIGARMSLKKIVLIIISIFSIISIMGYSSEVIRFKAGRDMRYLDLSMTGDILFETVTRYKTEISGMRYYSGDDNWLIRAIDDTMFRFYDLRSGSAIMLSIPNNLGYSYGKTFKHIYYAFIPRIFWTNKPSLRDIHLITKSVMFRDQGVSPVGTITEFYLAYGFPAVFIGGIICFLLCFISDRKIFSRILFSPAWIVVYPILSEQFLYMSYSFSQRVCAALRTLIVLMAVSLWFKYIGFYKTGAQKMKTEINN